MCAKYIVHQLCTHPSPETISNVKEWLKGLPSEGADAVDCGSLTLDKPQIVAIEKALYDMQVHCTSIYLFGVNVKCEILLHVCCLNF